MEDTVEQAPKLTHQEYLVQQGKEMAQKLLSGQLTPDQFADLHAQVILDAEKLADHDGLIKHFFNSVGFSEALEKELSRMTREQGSGTLLALDIDGLKKFNDAQGHLKGDALIRTYAKVMTNHTRDEDLRGRIGGDEFVVFLTNTDLPNSKIVAERIRTQITQEIKNVFPDLPWEQTISIGIASVEPQDKVTTLRERADQALYKAKEKKNKVCVFGEDETTSEHI